MADGVGYPKERNENMRQYGRCGLSARSIMDGEWSDGARLMKRNGEGVGNTAGEMVGIMNDEFYYGCV